MGARFLDTAALASDADFADTRADVIGLADMSVHAAKGLEFADRRRPVAAALGSGGSPRRRHGPRATPVLVGTTRARDPLIPLHALKRRRHGRARAKNLPFLTAIENELVKHAGAAAPQAGGPAAQAFLVLGLAAAAAQ
jgi:superfamily I DNA/RNA helicase